MPAQADDDREPRIQFSIGTLLWMTALVALSFLGFSQWHAKRQIQLSDEAETRLFQHIGQRWVQYAGPPPITPIFDDDGNIHPASCGPMVNFSHSTITKTYIIDSLPDVAALIPSEFKSHVGICLSHDLYADVDFVDKLRLELPDALIFDRTQYIGYFGPER